MSEGQEGGVEKDYNNRNLQENMKIIWIDGTFGIGKSAVAAAIVEEIPQAHLLEFDALQEKYKPTSVSDYFGKRYQNRAASYTGLWCSGKRHRRSSEVRDGAPVQPVYG